MIGDPHKVVHIKTDVLNGTFITCISQDPTNKRRILFSQGSAIFSKWLTDIGEPATVAGKLRSPASYKEGTGSEARFSSITSFIHHRLDPTKLMVVDSGNDRVRWINLLTNTTSPLAGDGTGLYVNITSVGTRNALETPYSIAQEPRKNYPIKTFITEPIKLRIRIVTFRNLYSVPTLSTLQAIYPESPIAITFTDGFDTLYYSTDSHIYYCSLFKSCRVSIVLAELKSVDQAEQLGYIGNQTLLAVSPRSDSILFLDTLTHTYGRFLIEKENSEDFITSSIFSAPNTLLYSNKDSVYHVSCEYDI